MNSRVATIVTITSIMATMALAAVGAILAAPTASGQEVAAPGEYVALGDSYSSGLGTREYYQDGTECYRSPRAYPALAAASSGLQLNLRACAGARVPDVTGNQVQALSAATAKVTVSIGGNDAGFADVLTECAKPAWASDCNAAIDKAENYINTTLPGQLDGLYAEIRSRAPGATALAVGYPRIFMGEDCNAGTFFSPQEQARLNQMADLLNSKARNAAQAHGLTFIDPVPRFTGHAVCDPVEWINGLSNPVRESYHPNQLGHRDGYAPLVQGPLGAGSQPQRQAVPVDQAALQRRYAAADAAIKPAVVRVPDLSSPQIRRAAAGAGVDLSDRASIDAADRDYSQRQAATHAERSGTN